MEAALQRTKQGAGLALACARTSGAKHPQQPQQTTSAKHREKAQALATARQRNAAVEWIAGIRAVANATPAGPTTLEQRLTRDDLRGSALKQVPQVLLVPIVVLLQETCQGRCKKEYKEASTSANNEATKCEPKGKNIKTA